MPDIDDADYRRLCWHSRRGMLELDLVLEPFVRHRYPQLGPADRASYRRLLECEDSDLYLWLLGRGAPADGDLARIVGQVRDHARAGSGTKPARSLT